jgi:hypothetical protein
MLYAKYKKLSYRKSLIKTKDHLYNSGLKTFKHHKENRFSGSCYLKSVEYLHDIR